MTTPKRPKPHSAAALLAAMIVALTSGCARVPAYDRGKLAHPTMAPRYADSPGRAHARAIHEGAVGGGIVSSSGCGCN